MRKITALSRNIHYGDSWWVIDKNRYPHSICPDSLVSLVFRKLYSTFWTKSTPSPPLPPPFPPLFFMPSHHLKCLTLPSTLVFPLFVHYPNTTTLWHCLLSVCPLPPLCSSLSCLLFSWCDDTMCVQELVCTVIIYYVSILVLLPENLRAHLQLSM